MARDAENDIPGIVPEEQVGEPTEDWGTKRRQDLLNQFGREGLATIDSLSSKYDDPDDAVREYRQVLRSRGEGEPI